MLKKILFLVFILSYFSVTAVYSQYEKYIWETYKSVNVSTDAQKMIDKLRSEIDKILAAGHLAPLRYNSTDIKVTGLYMYQEPGRIITTLAMAYPYLTSSQKDAVKTYVNRELSVPQWTVWSSNTNLHPTDGARREFYTMVGMKATQMWDPDSGIWVTTGAWQWDYWWAMDGSKRPRIQPLYGLWLYAYNANDWTAITNNWNTIKSFYNSRSGQGNIYGTMSAHIAMARMAYKMNDTTMMNTAISNANTNFGLSYSQVTANRDNYYQLVGYSYGGGSGRNSIHDAFHLLNLVPEVGRYLNENSTLRSSVISTNNSGKSKFPLWWLYRAKYFTVWCGEEGVGVPPELIGMIFPVERWVVGADRQTLDSYKMMYAMCGIGDCYVLEALVHTISKHGTDTWVDVRYEVTTDTTPPQAINTLSITTRTNNSITLSWTATGDDGNTGTASEYDIRYSLNAISNETDFNNAIQCMGEPLPQVAGTVQTFTVGNLSPGTTYYFRMKVADEVPNWSGLSNSVSGVTTGTPVSSSITVISPNGGETWTGNSVTTVRWSWQGAVGNVNIDISTDNGTNWTNLKSNTANDGTETVTAPNIQSSSCRIRVAETDGTPSDISDGTFTINQSQTLPQLIVSVTSLEFGEIEVMKDKTMDFTLTNGGGGTLSGNILSDSNWIIVSPDSFNSNNVTVYVTVDNDILRQREGIHTGNINITSNGGDAIVPVSFLATCVLAKPNPYEPDKGPLTFYGSGIVPGKSYIKIFTLSGEFVKRIDINDKEVYWDGKDENGRKVAPGIYVYTWTTPVETGSSKFTILR